MFFLPVVHDSQIWVFLIHFWDDDVITWGWNFKVSRRWFHKQILHLKVHFTLGFHLSINIRTWNINLELFDTFFGWWRYYGSQISNISESDIRNKALTKKFHQILISIFLSLSIHDTQLRALFTQFGDNVTTKETY